MEVIKKLLEFFNTDYGIYSTIGKVFPTNSVADHMGSNMSSIVYNPAITLAVISGIHLIIVIFIFPFNVMSYLISVPGSWLVFFLLFILLCRFFARCMMFPGALLPVQRSVSKEILRGIANQVNSVGQTIQEKSAQIHMCAKTGKVVLTLMLSTHTDIVISFNACII
jgi:hypothetical protein